MFRGTFLIISTILISSYNAKATSAPKCSAVVLFQRSEVEAKVTAIVKTISAHQMLVNQGIQGNQSGFHEAIRQIEEIVQNFPEMLDFYQAEMKQNLIEEKTFRKKVNSVIEKEKVLEQKVSIEQFIAVIKINEKPNFLFKKKGGNYFVIGEGSEFAKFISEIKDIQQILVNKDSTSIAVLKTDGTVVTWGDPTQGGDSSQVNLTNVQSLYAAGEAYAALKKDGTVVTWGRPELGGDSSHLDLTNVVEISSTEAAFAALKSDGTVVTWGGKGAGGDSSHLNLSNVKKIYSTTYAFAALKNDGSVEVWSGVKSSDYVGVLKESDLKDIKEIFSAKHAFAFLKNNNSVLTLGVQDLGGDSSQVNLNQVQYIFPGSYSFLAKNYDGTFVSWGKNDMLTKANISQVNLSNLKKVYSVNSSMAALKHDGRVVTWGSERLGGDSSAVQHLLYDIVDIIEVKRGSYIAIRKDGAYVLWGLPIGDFKNQILNFDLN